MTNLESMVEMSATMDEESVMGMAYLSSWRRIAPVPDGVSLVRGALRWRK